MSHPAPYRNAAFEGAFDADSGVATLSFSMPGGVNKVDRAMAEGLAAALGWAREQPGLRGLILATAHKNFCVGADIDSLFPMRDPAATFAYVRDLNALFRSVETAGVPVVCALTGSALGGGYELALSCHQRYALDDARLQVGLPEVSLGLIPGAGGTQRLPRLIGLQRAVEHITQGEPVRAPKALALGMVDALFPTRDALLEAAKAWILAHPGAKQPWDLKGFRFPGAAPDAVEARQLFMGAVALTVRKVAHTMPQVEAAICAIHEGAQVTFDRALEIEGRYFTRCAVSDHSKALTRTFWYHRNAAMKGEGLPHADHGFRRVAILGAGMMGAGLAFACAEKGFAVVLKDVRPEALEAARAHCEAEAGKKKQLSADARAALLGRIATSLADEAVDGCDLVIEAVVEDDAVKHAVTAALEPRMSASGVWASNTSAIPIGHLAKASARPAQFVGLHFFSPVEKMALVEIIAGEGTSEATVGRCVSFVKALGKMPIVVGDGFGFFTSRVFGAYLMEAVQLVAEGHDPVLVEEAARQAGMVVPPLKVFDEVSLRLGLHALLGREKYTGEAVSAWPGVRLLRALVEDHGRAGKAAGGGFYDYDREPRIVWPGLKNLVTAERPRETGIPYIQDRLMLIQAVETVRCLEEGILKQPRDAEVGAVFGIGFSPGSGGPLSWLDARGLPAVVTRLEALSAELGPRFAPPERLRTLAAAGGRFWPDPA